MRFLMTLWICKLVAFAVNLIDNKRGSNYSGMIALKLMPNFVSHFRGIDYSKVFFISGTNGKSTTTNLLYHTLVSAGRTVACNTEGANMMGGVATTLIKNSTLSGALNKEFLVLEIDERSLPGIRKAVEEKQDDITAYALTAEGVKEFHVTMGELTNEEREIILKGCLINYNRI